MSQLDTVSLQAMEPGELTAVEGGCPVAILAVGAFGCGFLIGAGAVMIAYAILKE
jgi:hypothetical protein